MMREDPDRVRESGRGARPHDGGPRAQHGRGDGMTTATMTAYSAKSIDDLPSLWDGFARLVRAGLGVTAFGAQIMELPPDYTTESHDEADSPASRSCTSRSAAPATSYGATPAARSRPPRAGRRRHRASPHHRSRRPARPLHRRRPRRDLRTAGMDHRGSRRRLRSLAPRRRNAASPRTAQRSAGSHAISPEADPGGPVPSERAAPRLHGFDVRSHHGLGLTQILGRLNCTNSRRAGPSSDDRRASPRIKSRSFRAEVRDCSAPVRQCSSWPRRIPALGIQLFSRTPRCAYPKTRSLLP